MTTTVDFDALQAAAGPKVTLLSNTTLGATAVSDDYSDFSVFDAVYLKVRVQLLHGSRGPASLTALVEHSDDGMSWSTAHSFSFTGDGSQGVLLSAPKAHVRATVSTGGSSTWYVSEVSVSPTYLDEGGGGGGSQPVAVIAGSASCQDAAGTIFNIATVIPVDPVDHQVGTTNIVQTSLPFAYGAGQVCAYSGDAGVSSVDTTNDGYDVEVQLSVSNADGTQVLVVSGQATAGPTGPNDSVVIATADISATTTVGDDLSYDPDTGHISSAAGGTYAVLFQFNGQWD